MGLDIDLGYGAGVWDWNMELGYGAGIWGWGMGLGYEILDYNEGILLWQDCCL